jgi:hypothetical protein
MAYFIFLKYLDSLEDFRKNPHVKIPPKSPSTNFQSLGIFKNQIFIQKRIFPSLSTQSAQRPAGPSSLSAQPRPTSPLPSAGPPGLSLSSLTDMRASTSRLLPRADRCRRRLACAHAVSWSTYSSSLPTTPPGRFPSETAAFIPLWRTTAAAHSPLMPGRPTPPPTL